MLPTNSRNQFGTQQHIRMKKLFLTINISHWKPMTDSNSSIYLLNLKLYKFLFYKYMTILLWAMSKATAKMFRKRQHWSVYQHSIDPSSGYDRVQATHNNMKFYEGKKNPCLIFDPVSRCSPRLVSHPLASASLLLAPPHPLSLVLTNALL